MSKNAKRVAKVRRQDPHYERESGKYENPLPSREYVIETLQKAGRPMGEYELADQLAIGADELDAFERRIRAMEREGQLMRNRKGALILPTKADLVACRIEGHPDGFGFARPETSVGRDKSADIFLDNRQMEKALHGDRVLVRVTGKDRRGRPEGSIVEVTERANTEVVGRVFDEYGVRYVVPEDRRLHTRIVIAPETPANGGAGKRLRKPKAGETAVQPGQVVIAEILEQPGKRTLPVGRIKEVLGNYADPGMEIEIALRKHDLPFEFPKAVIDEAARLPEEVVVDKDLGKREDLRDIPLVTIDGETAKDFDDAVFAEALPKGKGWRMIVAIADVSHYVRPGSPLDVEAEARGNSVYFPRRVIPMLPEKISNGLCSLNPDVDRLAMVCDAQINAEGEVTQYRFYPAVFRSRARLTYNQVWGWLSGELTPATPAHQTIQPQLQTLYALFKTLHAAREKRGAIDFDTVETQMQFNDHGKIEAIVPVIRNDAHRLIEECMLAANVCAADFLEKKKQPGLFRIHGTPSPEKLQGLRDFMKEFGLGLEGGDSPTGKDYGKLLDQIRERPDFSLLQTILLRSMQQAIYSPDNIGHFGLSYEYYTHFTSPIRRYPDLLVHRAIKNALKFEKVKLPADEGAWEEIGLHCSATERRADEATRDVEAWLKCYYMQDRVGEVFDGTISGVTAFGAFVTLDQVYVEGLVHISELGSDYFHYDPIRHCLLGERTKQQYRVGDRLRVKLVRADLESNRIDFVPASATDEAVQAAGDGAALQGGGEREALALARSRKTGRPLAVERHLLDAEMAKSQAAPRKKPVVSQVGTPAGKSRAIGRQKPAGKTPGRPVSGGKAKPAKAVKSGTAQKSARPAKPSKSPKPAKSPVASAKKAAKSSNRPRRAKA
ncbi:MAG: ribonuclease R [Rhodocyclaceae bacterium]|nr:ribonuclease R [Rhodocyclaceae bacterium]